VRYLRKLQVVKSESVTSNPKKAMSFVFIRKPA
jgi:hypothetical protein